MKVPGLLKLAVAPALAAMGVRLVAPTLRIRREEAAVGALWRAGTPAIYAVWHGRILLLPYLYGWRHARVLASRSRDGELVARFVARFGLEAVGASAEWRLHSWDEFRIPKPFARCVLRFGDPIRVPGHADRAAEEDVRKEVESALRALSWRVDEEARG